jgi:hypothetical protein
MNFSEPFEFIQGEMYYGISIEDTDIGKEEKETLQEYKTYSCPKIEIPKLKIGNIVDVYFDKGSQNKTPYYVYDIMRKTYRSDRYTVVFLKPFSKQAHNIKCVFKNEIRTVGFDVQTNPMSIDEWIEKRIEGNPFKHLDSTRTKNVNWIKIFPDKIISRAFDEYNEEIMSHYI